MKHLVEIKNSQPSILRIQYDLGNLCNYKCWYCFPGANEGTTGWPDINVVKYNLSKIIEFYFSKNIDEIQLVFLGGEPTLWKDLGKLVKHLTEFTDYDRTIKKLRISIWTNGSRTVRWWNEYGHYFDHVGISVHHEKVDLDHVIDVAKTLLNKDVSVLATVLMDHTAWDKCVSMVNYLISSKPKFMVLARPIYINGVATYNKDQLKYLKNPKKRNPSFWSFIKHIDKFLRLPKYTAIFSDGDKQVIKNDHYFILNDLNSFYGWKCTVGMNFLAISRLGTISGTCGVKLFGRDDFFNINDKNLIKKFNPSLEPVVCTKLKCLCAGEVVLSKWKDNNKRIVPIYEN